MAEKDLEKKEQEWEAGIDKKLDNIKEHLKQQDYEITRGKYLALMSVSGAVVLLGVSLAAQRFLDCYLCLFVALLIFVGLGSLFYYRCRWEKYKKQHKQDQKED